MQNPIAATLERLHNELVHAEDWQHQLDAERYTIGKRTERLRAAITALADLLPKPEREKTLLRLVRPEPRGTLRGHKLGHTDLTAAVMEVLATHPQTTIKGTDMLHHLQLRGLNRDNKCGSRALHRRAKMGIVTRIGHGTYRINIDHPELVRIRAKLAASHSSQR